jgi:subtilisin family serine protease
VRVAVVDSGIAPAHPHVGAVAQGTALVGEEPLDTADRLGHGTAVAAAIRDLAPDVELVPVRVLEQDLATTARLLARAIGWAVDHDVAIVNLSFGTTNAAHVPLFEEVLASARDAGVLVVAAARQEAITWYPGSLSGALGVEAHAALTRDGVSVLPTGLAASPFPRSIPGVPAARNLAGVSFAVANACGVLARAVECGAPRSPDGMRTWLEALAPA